MLVLKIKDEVNLEALKELGFTDGICNFMYTINADNGIYLDILNSTRKIQIVQAAPTNYEKDTILRFNIPAIILRLIQLDLVEFVEGGNE